MQPIFRTQLVWVRFGAATSGFGSSLPFPDQPNINGCYVVGAESIYDQVLPFTPDQTAVTPNIFDYSVTWNSGSDQLHQDVPCAQLLAQLNGGIWKEYTPFLCDFQKSRVTRRAAAVLAEPESVPFTIYYLKPDDLRDFDRLIAKLRGNG